MEMVLLLVGDSFIQVSMLQIYVERAEASMVTQHEVGGVDRYLLVKLYVRKSWGALGNAGQMNTTIICRTHFLC